MFVLIILFCAHLLSGEQRLYRCVNMLFQWWSYMVVRGDINLIGNQAFKKNSVQAVTFLCTHIAINDQVNI